MWRREVDGRSAMRNSSRMDRPRSNSELMHALPSAAGDETASIDTPAQQRDTPAQQRWCDRVRQHYQSPIEGANVGTGLP
jgi:hypothetical protein